MTVEVLYFDGCPSHERLLPRLRQMVASAGGDPDEIVLRRIETVDEAEQARFLGSPTVRIDGRDVDPTAAHREDYGLKCRLYRDGEHQSALPPERWLRDALAGRR